ncbi:AfsR/SARP family transcriptional regulator [Nonomuraea typhae]|uniref:AfsR/SARP family transcriptional regulator n=1 Tax=Nonomuraea typhae TaxID=2603600 RepID=UPI0015E244A0|nr:BTAD domain-containing putative transcriptional regulator [Nonomuraea typhae]
MAPSSFGILGPVMVVRAGRPIPVPAAKQRVALAALLLQANRHVPADQLIQYLWEGDTPRDSRAALHTHIARLRQVLGDGLIHTDQDGYLIRAGDDEVDVTRFHALVRRAGRAPGKDEEEALLQEALGLWRGPALADVPSAALHRDHAARLGEERLQALERWLQLGLEAGRHERIVADLRTATGAHPLRERLWAQLMLALYRSGRQAEALQAFHTIAGLLREELGIDPGEELRDLHQSILVGEPRLMPRAEPGDRAVEPRQLPSGIAAFTGRAAELRTLDGLLTPDGDHADRPARVAVITGTAGVGKTALAVHWGRRTRGRFPDGQLYVNLRGFGVEGPVEPAAALEALLQGLGVPAQRVPAALDARSALLRSVLADRRVLMVLDNARDVAQVRPLLPGSGCLVLITSRDQLRGLSLHGDTLHVTLGVFSPEESAALLTSILGEERTRAEPEATAELGRLCAHLPLALRIAVANLTLDRFQSVAGYVAELREGNRLAALRVDGDDQAAVRGAFDLSYAALPAGERAMFRLLGLVPGADFTAEAAAALADCPAEEARRRLAALAGAHLIDRHAPSRYRFHDLLRLYAAEKAEHVEDGRAARERLHAWYLHGVLGAVEHTHPHRARLPAAGRTGEVSVTFDGPSAAVGWLADEHRNLVAAVVEAARSGPRASAWLLTDALRGYFWTVRTTSDWHACGQAAVAAAEADGDTLGLAAALLALADAHAYCEQPEANALYTRALALAGAAGWADGQSTVRGNLAGDHLRHGRLAEAAHWLEEGMELDVRGGRQARLAVKHANLGVVYAQLGRLDAAYEHFSEVLEIPTGRHANARYNLGLICHLMGRFDEAYEHLTGVRADLERTPDPSLASHYLAGFSELLCDLGRYDEALGSAVAALPGPGVDDHFGRTLALVALGRVYQVTGRREEAATCLRQAVEVVGRGNPYTKAAALNTLAGVIDGAEATARAEEALLLSRERSFRVQEGRARTALARIALAAGDRAEGVRQAKLALEIHRETGCRLGETQTLDLL